MKVLHANEGLGRRWMGGTFNRAQICSPLRLIKSIATISNLSHRLKKKKDVIHLYECKEEKDRSSLANDFADRRSAFELQRNHNASTRHRFGLSVTSVLQDAKVDFSCPLPVTYVQHLSLLPCLTTNFTINHISLSS